MEKVGFGIIGCGIIAPYHIRGIKEVPQAELVAVCDEKKEKAQKLGKENNAAYFTDYQEMLKRSDINVVCICTPSSLHPLQAIAAAEAGKHIITEKPMAITLKGADKMIAACRKNNVKLGVIFQRRVSDVFRKAKEGVDKGEIGKLILGDAYIKYYRSQEYYDSAGWRGTWKFDGGGALMNQCIHLIDLLSWFMGPVDTIYGYAATLARKIEVEDTSVAVLKFKNGALGVIEGTTSIFPSTIPHRIELHGHKGSILIEGEDIRMWVVEDNEGKDRDRLAELKKSGKTSLKPFDFNKGHFEQIKDMVDAIKEDREPIVNGEEGRKSIEIILAIYKSSRTGKPVKLPL
jgi:predicted dehydrogenase